MNASNYPPGVTGAEPEITGERPAFDALPGKLNAIADEHFGDLMKDLDREPTLAELAENLRERAHEARGYDYADEAAQLDLAAQGVEAMAAAEAADPEPLPVRVEVTPRGQRMIDEQLAGYGERYGEPAPTEAELNAELDPDIDPRAGATLGTCGGCGERPAASPTGYCGTCLDAADVLDESGVDEVRFADEILDMHLAQAIEALEELAADIRRLGGVRAANPVIERFASYHLADLEGKEAGDWLGSGYLVDALRELREGRS